MEVLVGGECSKAKGDSISRWEGTWIGGGKVVNDAVGKVLRVKELRSWGLRRSRFEGCGGAIRAVSGLLIPRVGVNKDSSSSIASRRASKVAVCLDGSGSPNLRVTGGLEDDFAVFGDILEDLSLFNLGRGIPLADPRLCMFDSLMSSES
jgi:hypothetical protein